MNPDDLRRWRSDIVAWAEGCVHVRSPETGELGPLQLADRQKHFLREATRRGADGHFLRKICAVSWVKREGKSLSVALIVAWRLTCYANQRCGLLANSERQAVSVLFDALCSILRDSPALADLVSADGFQSRKLTVPGLGNAVECYPANHRTVQGIGFDVLACDELHASEDGGKAFEFASQQTEAADAQVLVSSQAGSPTPGNPLWRLWQAAQAGEPSILFDYRQDAVTPWARARAAQAKVELLDLEYRYLWCNEWAQAGAKLFDPQDVLAAADAYECPRSRDEFRQLVWGWGFEAVPCSVACALDRAGISRTGDRSVWSAVARFDPPGREPTFRVVQLDVLRTGAEAEVLAAWEHARQVFGGLAAVHLESYGCGDLVGRIPGAVLVTPTSGTQTRWFTTLGRLLREGRFAYPADAGIDPKKRTPGLLRSELLAFEGEARRGDGAGGALLRFGVQAGHDDSVYSVALGLDALPARAAFSLSDILGPPSKEAYRESPPTGLAGVGDGLGALDWFAR